jgi:glycosyltransferase involved in cell wall biosynthesis
MQLEVLKRVVLPVSNKVPHVLFCFVGGIHESDPRSAPYWEACLRAVDEMGLGRWVRFVGHQSEVYSWFIASDFSALASIAEGLPRVFVESLACSRAVVSTAVTTAREILETYECGFVTDHGDWEGITNRIIRLCQDTELRARMNQQAGEVARRLFDLDTVAGQYEALYLELAQGIAKARTWSS